MTNIKTMMEELAQEELERDGAACVEVMKHRKKNADGDLISRSALIAEYDRVHVGAPGGARKLMVDAPTVDAMPVVHSAWEIITDEYGNELMRCPVCRSEFYDGDNDTVDTLHNYCPNCGSRMDGRTK